MADKSKWRTLTKREKRELLSSKGTKRTRVHAFTRKMLHWPYCQHCGLVMLKNDVSRRAVRKPCVTYE